MAMKILAADDAESIREMVKDALTPHGYEVMTASNGYDAVNMAKYDRPDLLILDVTMPRLDGWEVRKFLKKDPQTAKIPIIFLSAHGEFESQAKGMTEDEDYLTKPFKAAELVELVQARLDPAHHVGTIKARDVEKKQVRAIRSILRRDHES